jgi:hypothetical protein
MYTVHILHNNLSLQGNLHIHYIPLPAYLHYTDTHSYNQTNLQQCNILLSVSRFVMIGCCVIISGTE